MADTRAYFKQYRLGDFLRGFPTVRVPLEQAPASAPGWGNSAVLHGTGRGAKYQYVVKCALMRGHLTANEDVRAFGIRKIALAKDVKTMAGIGAGLYTSNGHLVVIADPDLDTGIAINAPVIGTSVPCELAGPIAGLVVNDYVYLRTATQYDVAKVTATAAGGTLLTLDVVNNTYSDGVEVFRVQWVAPYVYLQQPPDITGNDSARDRQAVLDLDFTFDGVDDPWWGS